MTDQLAVDDPSRCGIGQGAGCCSYLTMTPGVGFTCEKPNPSMRALIDGKVERGEMTSATRPALVTPYPECQDERASLAAEVSS